MAKLYLKNKVAFIQFILYCVTFVLGFLISIPVGITLRAFQGNCVLYSQMVWGNTVMYTWSETSCDYILAVNMAINIFYAAFMIFCSLILIRPRRKKELDSASYAIEFNVRYIVKGAAPVFMVLDAIIIAALMASAIVLSVGLNRFCGFFMMTFLTLGQPLASCRDGQYVDWVQFSTMGGYTHGLWGGTFYDCLMLAIVCNWIVVLIWWAQLIMQLGQCCYNCSCEVAEEKKYGKDRTMKAAQKRFTPSATPGFMTPGRSNPSLAPSGAIMEPGAVPMPMGEQRGPPPAHLQEWGPRPPPSQQQRPQQWGPQPPQGGPMPQRQYPATGPQPHPQYVGMGQPRPMQPMDYTDDPRGIPAPMQSRGAPGGPARGQPTPPPTNGSQSQNAMRLAQVASSEV